MSDNEQTEERLQEVSPESPLYAALWSIYGEVRRLEQTQRNDHGKYLFTPADDFRDFIREQFHKHKLVYSISEVFASQVSEGMKAGTIKFTYQFVITHIDSGECTLPECRSVFLPYVGSQTSGIASTFALKEWLKNKFLISTGEEDPENKMGEADKRAGDKMTEPDSQAALTKLEAELADAMKAKKSIDIEAWWKDNNDVLNSLIQEHYIRIKQKMTAAWREFKGEEDLASLNQMTDAELDARAQQQDRVQ